MFTRHRIASRYADLMVAEVRQSVEQWRSAAGIGEPVDAHAERVDLASRIIGRILFGVDMTTALPEIQRFSGINDALLLWGILPHPTPRWVPTPGNRRLAAGLVELRAALEGIIATRRAETDRAPGEDMLGLLLSATDDESADRLTDAEVADQALIFLLAGHDTTASTMACLLVELAKAPQWQETVQEEVDRVLGGRAPTAADMTDLPWTGRAVREALRLYPAAHSIGRATVQEEVLGGYRLPAGATVVVCPWTVQRSAKVWDDPHTFDPRRFDLAAAGELHGGHRYARMPFGAGPHTCVGMQLALLEAQIVLVSVMQAFRVTTEVTRIPVRAAISMHPAAPLPARPHPVTADPSSSGVSWSTGSSSPNTLIQPCCSVSPAAGAGRRPSATQTL